MEIYPPVASLGATQQMHQRWINVKTTLIVNVHQRCFNVDIWLKMKVEPMYIYWRCSRLTKQRWNNVDRIASIQRRWTNVVSTLKFGWKWKLSRRMFIDIVSTLTKQRWNNVDRITLIQCWWPNVVSTLILGWKEKLSHRIFIGVEKTALKQLCQYLLYWGSLESGSIIKQN